MTTSKIVIGSAASASVPNSYAFAQLGFVVILAVAALVRLVAIGEAPMNGIEASQASAALAVARGERPELWADPIQTVLTAGIFFLFGSSDALARLVPVVAGVAVVGLVCLGWGDLGGAVESRVPWPRGRTHADETPAVSGIAPLIGASLLAVSSLSVQASRHLGGEAIAAAFAISLVLAWRRYQVNQTEDGRRMLSIFFVLTLLAGPAGFQSAVVLLAIAAFSALARPRSTEANTFRSLVQGRTVIIGWLVPALATLGLVSSALLVYPAGFGIPSISAWGERFAVDPSPALALYPLWMLLLYEPAIFVLALVGGWVALRPYVAGNSDDRGLGRFLVLWAVVEMALALLATTKTSGSLVVPLVPMALLSGVGGEHLIRRVLASLLGPAGNGFVRARTPDGPAVVDWTGIAAALVPLAAAVGFAYTVLGFFSQPGGMFKEFAPAAILIAVILLVGFLSTAVQRLGSAALSVLALAAIVVLAIAGIHASTSLNFYARPELVRPARGSIEVKLLADRIAGVANRLRGKAVTVVVATELRQPFAWYLRMIDGVSFVARPPSGPTVVVTRSGPISPDVRPDGFSSYQRHLARLYEPSLEGIQSLAGWWRWFAFREGSSGDPDVVAYFSRA